MKYFLYNKALDFKRGCLENCIYQDGVLQIQDKRRESGGVFISNLMDSREMGTVWGRLKAQLRMAGEGSVRLLIYSKESDRITLDDKTIKLQDYLMDCSISSREKESRLAQFLQREVLSPEDILLSGVKGRYLWFILKLYGQNGGNPGVEMLQIFFPASSWSRYLPSIYQSQETDSFLERYLAVFESIYGELEQAIAASDEWLNPRLTREDVAKWLAGWLGVEHIESWSGDRLRRFVEQAAGLEVMRGTRKGILKLVRLYTGTPVYLAEYQSLLPFMADTEKRKIWEGLFGTDRTACFLMVPKEAVTEPGSLRALYSLLEDVRPAQVPVRVIVLEERLMLGGHTYLGVNSKLEHLRPAYLDGASYLSFAALK